MKPFRSCLVVALLAVAACRETQQPVYDITVFTAGDAAQNPFAGATSVTLEVGGRLASNVAIRPGQPFSLSIKNLHPTTGDVAVMTVAAKDAAGKTLGFGSTPPLELGLTSNAIGIFVQIPGTLVLFPGTLKVPVHGHVFLSPPATGFTNVYPAPVLLGGRTSFIDTTGVIYESASPLGWVLSPANYSLDQVTSTPGSARFDSAALVTAAGRLVVFGGAMDMGADGGVAASPNPDAGAVATPAAAVGDTDVYELHRLDLVTFALAPVNVGATVDARVPRAGAVPVELAGRIYAFGGRVPPLENALDSVVSIDETAVAVSATGATLFDGRMAVARQGHTVTRVMGPAGPEALIFGGAPAATIDAVAEAFIPGAMPGGPATFLPLAGAGSNRSAHAAVSLPDGRVLIVGGRDDAGQALGDAILYAPGTRTFTPVPGFLKDARADATAFIVGGDLVVAGGNAGAHSAVATYEAFDALSLAPLAPDPRPAHGRWSVHATALPNGTVMLLGGLEFDGAHGLDIPSPFIEVYRPLLR